MGAVLGVLMWCTRHVGKEVSAAPWAAVTWMVYGSPGLVLTNGTCSPTTGYNPVLQPVVGEHVPVAKAIPGLP